jgi:hypothetical protein
MKNIELIGKVLKKYDSRNFDTGKRKGSFAKFLLADETGTMMVVLWNDKSALINGFTDGDTIKITNANARENNNRVELHLADDGTIDVNPEGVSIKPIEIAQKRSYPPAVRKKISELTQDDANAEIFATIVQVFDPRFFEVCPQCFKRVRNDGTGSYNCAEHGKVTPNYSAVLNIFVDDGSDNVRVVLWRNQIHELLGTNDAKLLILKDNPTSFEDSKTELLGVMAKFIGRVSNNDLFGRLEFVANRVFRNVNPEEELKNLNDMDTIKVNNSNHDKPNVPVMTPKSPSTAVENKRNEQEASDLDEEILSLEDLEDIEEDL